MNTALSIKVFSGGSEVGSEFPLGSVDIGMEINRIPWARLCYIDGDAAKPEFKVANSSKFKPGANIEIVLSYLEPGAPAKGKFKFKGFVTGHSLEVSSGQSVSVIELRDKAYEMTRAYQSRFFEKISDSEILSKILKEYKDVGKGSWASTKVKHEKMLQFDCTDWDFMLMRAEANGLLVAASNNEINLLKAGSSFGKGYALDYGNGEIFDLEMQADGSHQIAKQTAMSWDYKQQKSIQGKPPKPLSLKQGDLKGKSVASKIAPLPNQLFSGTSSLAPELDAWSNGKIARSRLSLYRGRVSTQGMPAPKLGDSLKLKGLGDRFDGKALISGIRHRISSNGWLTDLQIGMDSEPHYQKFQTQSPPAAGLLPGVHGLQIGVVAPFKKDPQSQFRVKVKLPTVSKKEDTFLWARLLMPDGGHSRGWFFYPEPGDEVLVGFLNGDPRQPIILGALFSSKQPPPAGMEKVDAKNAKKGIITKGGHTILFDDTEQVLTIQTSDPPKKDKNKKGGDDKAKTNTIKLDHKNGTIDILDKNENLITLSKEGLNIDVKAEKGVIKVHDVNDNAITLNKEGIAVKSAKAAVTVEDKSGNKLTLNEDGVSVKSDKAFIVSVKGNKLTIDSSGIEISSGSKMTVKASGKVEVQGAAIDLK